MEELLFWQRILCKKTEGDMGGGGNAHPLEWRSNLDLIIHRKFSLINVEGIRQAKVRPNFQFKAQPRLQFESRNR